MKQQLQVLCHDRLADRLSGSAPGTSRKYAAVGGLLSSCVHHPGGGGGVWTGPEEHGVRDDGGGYSTAAGTFWWTDLNAIPGARAASPEGKLEKSAAASTVAFPNIHWHSAITPSAKFGEYC